MGGQTPSQTSSRYGPNKNAITSCFANFFDKFAETNRGKLF